MNLFPFLATFVLAVCFSVEGFSLKCSSGNPSVLEYFARESQKVADRITGIWERNQHSTNDFGAFIANIELDVPYESCLISLGSTRFENPSEFRRAVKKCGVYVCEKAKRELGHANALNEVIEEVVRVEVDGFNDPDPSFDEDKEDEELFDHEEPVHQQESVAVPKKTRIQSSETVDVQKVALILLLVGLIFTIVFMVLRALYPLRNKLIFGENSDGAEPFSEQRKDVGKEEEMEEMTEEAKDFNPTETQTYATYGTNSTNATNANPNGGYSFSTAPPAYRK